LGIPRIGYTAKRLLDVVRLLPGVHLREVQRRAGLGMGNTVYQLGKLESLGLVESEKYGRYRRYFPTEINMDDRTSLSALLNSNRRQIILCLLEEKSLGVSNLASKLRIRKSTANWHLRILESANLVSSSKDVEGSVVWSLTNPERAKQLLKEGRSNLLTRLGDSYLESWDLLGNVKRREFER